MHNAPPSRRTPDPGFPFPSRQLQPFSPTPTPENWTRERRGRGWGHLSHPAAGGAGVGAGPGRARRPKGGGVRRAGSGAASPAAVPGIPPPPAPPPLTSPRAAGGTRAVLSVCQAAESPAPAGGSMRAGPQEEAGRGGPLGRGDERAGAGAAGVQRGAAGG